MADALLMFVAGVACALAATGWVIAWAALRSEDDQ
jgi:hypothetical protein